MWNFLTPLLKLKKCAKICARSCTLEITPNIWLAMTKSPNIFQLSSNAWNVRPKNSKFLRFASWEPPLNACKIYVSSCPNRPSISFECTIQPKLTLVAPKSTHLSKRWKFLTRLPKRNIWGFLGLILRIRRTRMPPNSWMRLSRHEQTPSWRLSTKRSCSCSILSKIRLRPSTRHSWTIQGHWSNYTMH